MLEDGESKYLSCHLHYYKNVLNKLPNKLLAAKYRSLLWNPGSAVNLTRIAIASSKTCNLIFAVLAKTKLICDVSTERDG